MFKTVNFAHKFLTPPSCCALSNDGQTIACGFTNGQVILLKQGQAPLALGVANNVAVTACAFSPDNAVLGAIKNDNICTLYTLKNPERTQSVSPRSHISCSLYIDSDKTLSLGHADGFVTQWNTQSVTLLYEGQAQSARINACVLNSAKTKMVLVSSPPSEASKVNVLQNGGRLLGNYTIKTKILACSFDSDGETILLANGASLHKLHLKTGLSPLYFSYSADLFNPAFVAFSPDGKRILFVKQVVAGYNFTIIATDSLLQNPVAGPAQLKTTDRDPLLPSSSEQSRGFFSCFTDCFRR